MSSEEILYGLALIVTAGIAAQWLALRLGIPSILVLLVSGFTLGAVNLLNPDELFGQMLFPLISVSVGVILYEGSLSLRLRDVAGVGKAVFYLISIGAAITWLGAALAAHYVLGIDAQVAVLLGAILMVSGPTVVTPLLQHVRPKGRVGSVLRWEGILIDPIGAILAVITLQLILAGDLKTEPTKVVSETLLTTVVGVVIGLLGAGLLVVVLKRYLLPDMFQNSLSLAMVIATFALANGMRHEAGLLAVTVAGVALANQRFASVQHIVEFKENLFALIIGSLFIILGARLKIEHIEQMLNWRSAAFLAILILVLRPISALISTRWTRLNGRERIFIAWLMPRGIVAASVASIFAIQLEGGAIQDADLLVPYTFLVIIGTVVVYGLTSLPLARYLGLAGANPQGVLILGAHPLGQELAVNIQLEGYRVLLVDANRGNIRGARLRGLPTYYGNILSEYALDDMDLHGIGRLLALTSNDEVNSLAAVRLAPVLERRNVFQVAPERVAGTSRDNGQPPRHLRGRIIGSSELTLRELTRRLREGWSIKRTTLTENFDYERFLKHYEDGVIPVILISEEHGLQIFNSDGALEPQPGDRLISLVQAAEVRAPGALQVSPDRVLTAEEMENAGLLSSYCDWQSSVSRHGGTRPGPGRPAAVRVNDS